MDYTSIHIYGHLLSDDILRSIEQDSNLLGNRELDFGIDAGLSSTIDYAWGSMRNDWQYAKERNLAKDPYGTRRSRDFMERMLQLLGYQLDRQSSYITAGDNNYDITYLCPELNNLPVIVIGDKTGEATIDTLDKCSLDYRAKGEQRRKSPHATMLEYLNSTECIYGIISNGQTLRLIRNSGQLVKLTYIEFDLRRMMEEDKYTEFCLMFRLLHASRFRTSGDEPSVLERWFNMSIESGNRIRAGLSLAVQKTMETIGNALVKGSGEGNEALRAALSSGSLDAAGLNKELIHFIYRLLFLFIIEDRNLVYQIPESPEDPNYATLCRYQDLYKKYYAASRLRGLSELNYLHQRQYHDLWQGLMDTFRLFESEEFGSKLGILPLGGMLFNTETLHYLKSCQINNDDLLVAFAALNEFIDERGARVKINYSALDVEEFGSVYEGILEMRPFIQQGVAPSDWSFGFVGGLDRQSTSSYYTRPDLVQNLIRTTLEPVIKERISKLRTPEEKVKSLLKMKVCDPASGSGHIVLAMARTIAWYVSSIRTGEDNPASLDYREALREVIQKCVYAVDYNPDAVELCKVVLWIEGYCAGRPLSFLDHHIRCGNSVLGVTNLQMLIDGVPSDALTAEDNPTKRQLKRLNDEAIRMMNMSKNPNNGELNFEDFDAFGVGHISTRQIDLAERAMIINALPEETLEQEEIKKRQWEDLMASERVSILRDACDTYTYAFYHTARHDEVFLPKENGEEEPIVEPEVPYSKSVYRALQAIEILEHPEKGTPYYYTKMSSAFHTVVFECAQRQRFFHWCVEFPEVFAYDGGFDVMCGNPPWDKIKVEDKKWFESHGRSDIVNAGTAAQRKRKIAELPETDPQLYREYVQSQLDAEALSRFVRLAGRFDLTAIGDIDLYPLFAEHCLNLTKESWGLVIPTGIAVNDSNKLFFSKLIDENRLISIYDFENRELLFPIHRQFKFSLLTAGKKSVAPREVNGGFFLYRIDHLLDSNRVYSLKTTDFARLNPNTKTCPIFRTSKDAIITNKIYCKSSILFDERQNINPWKIRFGRMFDMSNDSSIFYTAKQLTTEGADFRNSLFYNCEKKYLPLFEGKMIWLYNHHYSSWPKYVDERPQSIPCVDSFTLSDPNSSIYAWYYVQDEEVKNRLIKTNSRGQIEWQWKHNWFLAYRGISNVMNERTFIISLIPRNSCSGNSLTELYADINASGAALLLGMMSSLVFDYVVRQKIGWTNINTFFVKQFPILTPLQIPEQMTMPILIRVVQLCYFNHDLDGWAEELWEELDEQQREELPQLGLKECFIYDPDRRAVLQAELDAIFAHLYGLSTEDLRYILDPEDVCGPGCINETFRVLKDNEIREFGEYRTKRLVLKAWYDFGYDN